MGDLKTDTNVVCVKRDESGATYSAQVSPDWEIWGPNGGYIAALALRAVGELSPFLRPASLACHFISVASFDEVKIEVVALREGKKAHSHKVTMTQGKKTVLEAFIWSIGEVQGLEHHLYDPPDIGSPKTFSEREPIADNPRFPFWENIEGRFVTGSDIWPPKEPLPPKFCSWCRFRPTEMFEDPWVDAGRSLILIDVSSFPSGIRPHMWKQTEMVAPSLDLYVAFHQQVPNDPWLFIDGYSPVSFDGLLGWNTRLWSQSGSLVASGMGQALWRPAPSANRS